MEKEGTEWGISTDGCAKCSTIKIISDHFIPYVVEIYATITVA